MHVSPTERQKSNKQKSDKGEEICLLPNTKWNSVSPTRGLHDAVCPCCGRQAFSTLSGAAKLGLARFFARILPGLLWTETVIWNVRLLWRGVSKLQTYSRKSVCHDGARWGQMSKALKWNLCIKIKLGAIMINYYRNNPSERGTLNCS